MRISVNNHPSPGLIFAAVVTPLLLAACVPAQQGGTYRACEQDCLIDIELPADPVKPPKVKPEKIHYVVKAGTDVNFVVDDPRDTGRTLLVFRVPAFTDRHDKAVYVLHVKPGQGNSYKARPGVCPSPGCKYMIVNYGRPEREPLDPWIIIE